MRWDVNMSMAKIWGIALSLFAIPLFMAVALNSHTRELGGHNLLPLIYPAGFLLLVGLGLLLDRPWSRLFAQLLCGGVGILLLAITVSHLKLYDFTTNLFIGFIPALALLIPALVAGRTYLLKRREHPAG